MKYKPLSVNNLPRVFVNLLAQEDEGIVIFAEAMNECEEMKTWYSTTRILPVHTDSNREDAVSIGCTRRELSRFFRAVLKLSKPSRGFFVKDFTRLLNELGTRDFWGTEGQCDPRGDRRDLDPYR
jgi:hypothetical protein